MEDKTSEFSTYLLLIGVFIVAFVLTSVIIYDVRTADKMNLSTAACMNCLKDHGINVSLNENGTLPQGSIEECRYCEPGDWGRASPDMAP